MPDGSTPSFHRHLQHPSLCHKPSEPDMTPSFIETLPEEVLTSILECACLCEDDTVGHIRGWLSTVSRRWQRIILHTPSFWSVLHLSPSQTPNDILQSLDIHLERSKQYPLEIRLRCYWHPKLTKAVFERIIPHSHRWKRLSIQTPSDEIFSYLQSVPGPCLEAVELYFFSWEGRSERQHPVFPMTNLSALSTLFLRNMTLAGVSSLPQLKRLDLRSTITWSAYSKLCDILDGSSVLEHLTLHLKPLNVSAPDGARVGNRKPISLPALRNSYFITSEGLSPNISRLMQLLSSPSLESTKVQDIGSGAESETLMHFTKTSTPASNAAMSNLFVRSSDPYLAWASLSPSPAVTTLELKAPQWPARHQLEELFMSLSSLETLVIREFQASTAVNEIGAGPAISIPSLQTLDIEFMRTSDSEDHHISQFFRILSLPRLCCLRLQRLLASEWENMLCCFYYPSLCSLTLVDMNDFLMSTGDPSLAFPHLTDLQLVNVRANDFLQRLLQRTRSPSPGWPELRTLTIHGDDLISKPLLHQVVTIRHKKGLRMPRLVLEKRYFNEESRDWLTRRCYVEFIS